MASYESSPTWKEMRRENENDTGPKNGIFSRETDRNHEMLDKVQRVLSYDGESLGRHVRGAPVRHEYCRQEVLVDQRHEPLLDVTVRGPAHLLQADVGIEGESREAAAALWAAKVQRGELCLQAGQLNQLLHRDFERFRAPLQGAVVQQVEEVKEYAVEQICQALDLGWPHKAGVEVGVALVTGIVLQTYPD